MKENNIGAAARRQCQAIIGRILYPSIEMRVREMTKGDALTIVDITCGAGEFLSGLRESCPELSKFIGFDPDPVNLVTTTKRLEQYDNIQLYPTAFEKTDVDFQADFVIGACTLNDNEQNRAILKKAGEVLVLEGVIILNFVDLSQTQSFPKSYALKRYDEFQGMFQRSLGIDLTYLGIRALCAGLNFREVNVHRTVPRFLIGQEKMLPALLLEYMSTFLLERGMCSGEELEAIISELHLLSDSPQTLISAPVVYELSAVINK